MKRYYRCQFTTLIGIILTACVGPLEKTSAPASGDVYSLTVSPAQLTMAPGTTATATVQAGKIKGSGRSAKLSHTPTPAGVSLTFSGDSVSEEGSQALAVAVAATVPDGDYSVMIGSDGTEQTRLSLTVRTPTDLSNPGPGPGGGNGNNGGITLSLDQTQMVLTPASTGVLALHVQGPTGTNYTITATSPAPTITDRIDPPTLQGSGAVAVTVGPTIDATSGSYPITFTVTPDSGAPQTIVLTVVVP